LVRRVGYPTTGSSDSVFEDNIFRGDLFTKDKFSFRVVETKGWCRGFREIKIDEEEEQGTTEA
jgi:hypothetical protein